ncbi:hypothetical protein LV164_002445 [Aspergillus fumigatus]|nr:hypothetical protein KXX42_001386 [Aspergillus fumigatus]KAH1556692.1 hypothetical protein KXX57_000208 [Aspergillus fumigatus]KAH1981216.1 hypothetical protein KXW88_006081 [Aspergillus fumigatus]KAH2313453.1 hypothetical protein KXV47_003281 [Aspergillus fumigatus]KAH2667992.1 hypothetical protein KXV32_005461 [Aspergillus fumigatus]
MSSVTAEQWLEAAAYRRTVYGLAGTSKVSDKRVEEIVSKPVRVSLAFGAKHKELWSIIIKVAEPVLTSMNPDLWARFGPILEAHKAAYGSVLFWECGETIKESSEKHKHVAHKLGEWSDVSQGMHQILVWTALGLEGVGANLQHTNSIPPIEAAIKKFAGVPEHYTWKAHLNYGDKQADHPEKPAKLPMGEILTIL